MADIGNILGNVGNQIGTTMDVIMMMAAVMLVVGTVGGTLIYFLWEKKKWNLKVEFKIPRSDGKIVNGEWGKGAFNARTGKVWVKRKGVKKVMMKTFDTKKYLQGSTLLTVIQLSPIHYIPVLPRTFTHLIDEKTGKEAALMDLYADFSESKSWRNSVERDFKKAFSITSMFQQFQVPIAIGITALMIFVGFAIIWGRLPSICG